MRIKSLFLGIISELALYGLIGLVLVTAWFVVIERHGPFQRDTCQRIVLRFEDANALSVGSPINFMGTPIGHVVKLRPYGHQVEVKIKTYPNSVPIPKNARFTIEFNSLAGAKSVEILPPEKGPLPLGYTRQGLYVIRQPIRLKDVVNTQMTLAEALESSSANFIQTLGQLEDAPTLIGLLQNFDTNLNGVKSTLTYIREVLLVSNTNIQETRASLAGNLAKAQGALAKAQHNTNPKRIKVPTLETLRYIHHGAEDWQLFLTRPQHQLLLKPQSVSAQALQHSQRLETWHQHMTHKVPKLYQGWGHVNGHLAKASSFLERGIVWAFQLKAWHQTRLHHPPTVSPPAQK